MIHAFLMMAASATFQAGPAEKALPAFTSKEGGFTINLPGKPTEAIKEVPTPAGALVNKIFQASDGKTSFFVICADYPGEIPPDQVEAMLDGIRSGYLSSTGGKLVDDKKITFEKLPGREVTLEIRDAVQRARYFLRGDRIYQIFTVQAKSSDDPATFRRFVDSFKLGKIIGGLKEAPLAEAAWEEYHSVDGGFRVRMIGRPVDEVQKANSPIGPIKIRNCASTNGEGESYVVYASELAKANRGLAPDAMFDSVLAGAIANQPGSKVIRQKPIKLGDIPGREVEIELPPNQLINDLTFFVHYYLTKDQLFQVAFIGSKAKIPSKPVADFLASFRFDQPDAAPKDEKKEFRQ